MKGPRPLQAEVPAPRGTSAFGEGDARPPRIDRVLLTLLIFNGLTAVGGGIALVTGVVPTQPIWLQHMDFTSPYVPGVMLAAVIVLVWMVVESASIRGFHVLQVVYLVTGPAVIWRTPRMPSGR